MRLEPLSSSLGTTLVARVRLHSRKAVRMFFVCRLRAAPSFWQLEGNVRRSKYRGRQLVTLVNFSVILFYSWVNVVVLESLGNRWRRYTSSVPHLRRTVTWKLELR